MPALDTAVTDRLDIEYPIVQAPVGSATCPALAAAVADAGATGTDVRRYEDSLATPDMTGDVEQLPLYAGQSVGATGDVRPAEDLVATLAEETLGALDAR